MPRVRKSKHKKKFRLTCQNCGRSFMSSREDTRWCESYCKQDNHKKQKLKKQFEEDKKYLQELTELVPGLKLLIEAEKTEIEKLKIVEDCDKHWKKRFSKTSPEMKKAYDGVTFILIRHAIQDTDRAIEYLKNRN